MSVVVPSVIHVHFWSEGRKEQLYISKKIGGTNKAQVGEVGELSECFQWKGEVQKGLEGFSDEEKIHVGEEMVDVFVYLIRLADKCNVDLPSAITRKMTLNEQKVGRDHATQRQSIACLFGSTGFDSSFSPSSRVLFPCLFQFRI